MFTGDLTFPFLPGASHEPDGISSLIGPLRFNGQVLGRECPAAIAPNGVRVAVTVPAPDALERRHDNAYVGAARDRLAAHGLDNPSFHLVGRDPGCPEACGCVARPSLILYTDYASVASPLRCSECFGQVPLYDIPTPASGEFFDVVNWQRDYQACDSLQMHCSTGERFALAEMSRPDSSLSRRGRDICANLSAATGLPVYYYLTRARGHSLASEGRRRCPNCGGEWALNATLHSLFHFRCDACHLLSNRAWTLSNSARGAR